MIWVCFISVEATIKGCRALRAEPTQMKHTQMISRETHGTGKSVFEITRSTAGKRL